MRTAKTKKEFLELLKNQDSDSYEDWFYSIANSLMNYFCLAVGKNEYRITECEIYFNDGINGKHCDPFVDGFIEEKSFATNKKKYKKQYQKTLGQLYLNKAGGLDLTFGNDTTHAGILIRGIKNLETKIYINQITYISLEVLFALGNIISDENGINIKESKEIFLDKPDEPYKTKRARLSKKIKEKDNKNYGDMPYRYIVEFDNSKHDFFDCKRLRDEKNNLDL